MSHEQHPSEAEPDSILLPKPTAWPFVMAFGVTLVFLGLVTYPPVTALGLVLTVISAVGWFRQVLPHEAHEFVPLVEEHVVIATDRPQVAQVRAASARLDYAPVETHPMASGIKAGVAGGFAMILPALFYGWISHHSIWWTVNLLGGAGVAHWTNPSVAAIASFHWQWLLIACVIQAAVSLLVGILYGALLPMLPRRHLLLGGVAAPLLWTIAIHSVMNTINPVLDHNISWGWFLVSQIVFGLVAAWIVSHDMHQPAGTRPMPLAMRMGIEASGLMHEREEDEDDRA